MKFLIQNAQKSVDKFSEPFWASKGGRRGLLEPAISQESLAPSKACSF